MSTFIPPTPAATKSAEQHEEPSEQDSFNHLLYKVLRLTSEQVQDLNDWMKHQGVPNVHEIIAQNFRKPHTLQDDLQFIREGKPCYIQSNVMVSLSLMITYIKHLPYSTKSKHFWPFYYIQIDPQDYDEWRVTPPEEEVHFQTPSKLGSPATPRSMATSEASESYITLTNFKKGIKRDASAYPIFKNERYYNTFIHHFKATAKAQGLSSLMDPNFTPGSDEYEQQLFREQQDFLYSVLISSLKTDFSEALVKDHEGDAQLILELLHEHHTGNSQYSRSEINRITKYLTNIKLDDTWRGTNESFLMHYNDQLRLLDSLVDSDEKLPDNTRVTFLESAVESVPDLRRVKITDNVLQAQLDSTRPISYRSYFDLLKDAAFHLDQATKRGNKIRRTNVHFSGPNDEDEHQNLSSDDNRVTHQEDVYSEPPEPLSYSLFQSHFQDSSTPNTQKIFLPKPIWEKLSKDQQQMIIDHNRSLPKSGSTHLSTPNKSPSPLPHKPTPQQTAKYQQVHTHQSDEGTTDTTKTETTPSDPLLAMVHQSIHSSDDDASDISNVLSVKRSRQIQVCQRYLFQHANHTNQQLVDHGANGGLAGSDMRVIHKTHRKINIQGIDNHEVTGLDVVTAATLLNTSQGKVIGIFNEYAYLGKGSSIHSSGRLEWLRPMLMKNLSKLVVPNLSLLWMDILSLSSSRMVWPMPPPLENPQIRTWTHIHMTFSLLLMNGIHQSLTMILHTLMDWTPVKSLTNLLVTPCLMPMEISMSASLPTSTSSWMHLQKIVGHTQKSLLFSQPISIRVHPKGLTGMPYTHSLHGHPHLASRTLSMSPPGMGLLLIPRITSRSTLSLAILFSTSPDAVKLLQQTPSSLTLLLLMMVPPWPNSSVALILLSVMHMASNQPNNSSTLSVTTSENGEPWISSSVMEVNMKYLSESLISSIPYSSKIISLNPIINTRTRLKIILDLPSVTPTLS